MRSAVSDLSRAVSDAAGGAIFVLAPTIVCSDTVEEGVDDCRKKPPLPTMRVRVK